VLIVMNLNETIHPFFSIIGSANTKKKIEEWILVLIVMEFK
jgi:hypothetical protein